jgi:hypothetical protein
MKGRKKERKKERTKERTKEINQERTKERQRDKERQNERKKERTKERKNKPTKFMFMKISTASLWTDVRTRTYKIGVTVPVTTFLTYRHTKPTGTQNIQAHTTYRHTKPTGAHNLQAHKTSVCCFRTVCAKSMNTVCDIFDFSMDRSQSVE